MFGFEAFPSRKEKEHLLKEIIQKLSISDLEKDMYSISIDVLDDKSFKIFYEKIMSHFSKSTNPENLKHITIEPLTGNIIS